MFNAVTNGRRSLSKIWTYMALLTLSSVRISHPGPFSEQQLQTMMSSPQCLTVAMMFLGCHSAFSLPKTKFLFWSHLTSWQSLRIFFWIIQIVSGKLWMDLDMCFLVHLSGHWPIPCLVLGCLLTKIIWPRTGEVSHGALRSNLLQQLISSHQAAY